MGLIEGFVISRDGPIVPLIQFAFDFLLLLKVEVEGMRHLRCILLIMKVVIRLKVNWANSYVSPVGDTPSIGQIASILGCDIAPLPITYLGLPLGAKSMVIKKVGGRWASWKGHYLSKGGRLVLLKSVLSSLPMYFLLVF